MRLDRVTDSFNLSIKHLAHDPEVLEVGIGCIKQNNSAVENDVDAVPATGNLHMADLSGVHERDFIGYVPVLDRKLPEDYCFDCVEYAQKKDPQNGISFFFCSIVVIIIVWLVYHKKQENSFHE